MNHPVFRIFLFTLFVTISSHAYTNTSIDSLKPFDNSRYFTVDSLIVHCRVWNDTMVHPRGKVLLVHGFIGSSFSWRENVDTLIKSGYYVVCVDMPGFGYSDRNPEFNQSQGNRATFLLKLIDMIDPMVQWNLVGHSMGGGTVEAMALMRPDRIRSLTIVDGMVFLKSESMKGAFVTLSRNKQYKRAFSSVVKKNMFTYGMIERLSKKNIGYKPDSAFVLGYLEPLLLPGTAECVINVWANAKESEVLKAVGFSKFPILVVWGEKDKTIYLSKGKRFVKHVPSAELKIIPGAYHDPMETHPGIFNDYLVGFLNTTNELMN